jgi:hypothetical protein
MFFMDFPLLSARVPALRVPGYFLVSAVFTDAYFTGIFTCKDHICGCRCSALGRYLSVDCDGDIVTHVL